MEKKENKNKKRISEICAIFTGYMFICTAVASFIFSPLNLWIKLTITSLIFGLIFVYFIEKY